MLSKTFSSLTVGIPCPYANSIIWVTLFPICLIRNGLQVGVVSLSFWNMSVPEFWPSYFYTRDSRRDFCCTHWIYFSIGLVSLCTKHLSFLTDSHQSIWLRLISEEIIYHIKKKNLIVFNQSDVTWGHQKAKTKNLEIRYLNIETMYTFRTKYFDAL